MTKFKFVNASDQTVFLSDPRGGRIALAPGQSVTDPYYSRYARNPGDKPSGHKCLIRVAIDGLFQPPTAELPVPARPARPARPVSVRPAEFAKRDWPTSRSVPRVGLKSPVPTHPYTQSEDGSCITACEQACMTVVEFDISPEPPAQVPEVSSFRPVISTPAIPAVSSTRSTSLTKEEQSVEAKPIKVGTIEVEKPKPITHTTEEVLAHHGFTRSDVTKDQTYYVFVAKEGKLTYLSKLDLEFSCSKRAQMLEHVKQLTGE